MDYSKIDLAINDFIQEEAKKGNCIACGDGCSDCCKSVPLMLSPSEIDVIVQKLNSLNKHQKKSISKNIKQLDKKYTAQPENINSHEKLAHSKSINMNYQCPFLLGNRCAIYEVRPIICRTYFSTDKTLCKSSTGNLIFKLPEELAFSNTIDGYDAIGKQFIKSHAHRSIDFKDGKFISLSKILISKAKSIM